MDIEHDPDDPPPQEGAADNFWWFANRWAEAVMAWA